jgi:hypothetical protein
VHGSSPRRVDPRHPEDAGWIRSNIVSRARVTVDWPFVRELIVERNAALGSRLLGADGFRRSARRK